VCAALGSVPVSSADGPGGLIRGHVLDRTSAVRAVARQPVRLEIVERGSTSERLTVTDGRGAFAFPGLPVGGGVPRVFLVRTEYQGVPYGTRVELAAETPTQTADLDVYQATRDHAAVHGTIAFAVVETSQGAVRISVIQRLENTTRRAVVGSDADPLVFPLPLGAQAVELIGGWQHPQVAHGAITDAIAVPPGVLQVGYAYDLAPRARRFTLDWALPYGAADVEMLVNDPALTLSGAGVRRAGVVADSGRHFTRWSAGAVPRGGEIAWTFDGLAGRDDRWPGGAAIVLCVLLGGGLTAALRRRPTAAS